MKKMSRRLGFVLSVLVARYTILPIRMAVTPVIVLFCVLFTVSTTVQAQNLVSNGGFESGYNVGWAHQANNGGAATFSNEASSPFNGTNALKVAVSSLGANNWNVQSLGPTASLTTNKDYTLTVQAKAVTGGSEIRMILQDAIWTASPTLSLTTNWQKYTWNFTAQESSPQLKNWYLSADTIWVDEFYLTPRPYFEWDAATDTPGDTAWPSTGSSSEHSWTFDTTVSPVSVSDPRFTDITNAYAFPAAMDDAASAWESYDSNLVGETNATFEFVLDIDNNDGLIFETGGSGDGIVFYYTNDVIYGVVKDNTTIATNSYALTATDVSRLIHIVWVVDMDNDLFQLYVDGEMKDSAAFTGNDWCGGDNSGLGGQSGDGNNSSIAPDDTSRGAFTGKLAQFRYFHDLVLYADDVLERFDTLNVAEPVPALTGIEITPISAVVSTTTDFTAQFIYNTNEASTVTFDFSAFGLDGSGMDVTPVSTSIGDYNFTGFDMPPSGVTVDNSAKTISFTGGTLTNGNHTIENAVAGIGWRMVNASSEATHSVTVSVASATNTVDLAIYNLDPPNIVMLSPANNATDVSVYTELTATFDENIFAGAGNIIISNATDATTTSIAATDTTQVSISNNILTITPNGTLEYNKEYVMLLEAGAVRDAYDNEHEGFGPSFWTFSTHTFGYDIIEDNSLIPSGLTIGDTFHLVFLTSTETNRNSGAGEDNYDISHWNQIVNTVATGSNIEEVQNLTWFAIASTTTTDAKDNASVSAPVYRIDGTQVATGYADMWDGSIMATININENGAVQGGDRWVWSGSNSDGTKRNALGDGANSTTRSDSTDTNANWITFGSFQDRGPTSEERFYALSEPITIITDSRGSVFRFQ